MNPCKRMVVIAIGIKGTDIYTATNYNSYECSNLPGECGCIHAEIALFEKVIPDILVLSHSPCINCAQEIIKHGIKIVLYKNEYRIKDGIVLLKNNGTTILRY